MIACMYFIAHLIHCKEKKTLALAALLQSKTNPTTNVIAHRIIIPWKIVTRTPSGSCARNRKHKYGLCHSRAFVCNLDSEQQCSLPNSEIMVCKN